MSGDNMKVGKRPIKLHGKSPEHDQLVAKPKDAPVEAGFGIKLPFEQHDLPETAALNKVQGLVDEREVTGGVGASQIVHNLTVIEDGKKAGKIGAGIAGMMLAISLTFGGVTPAHAQDSLQVPTTTHGLYLPHQTGPPTVTSLTGHSLSGKAVSFEESGTVFGARMNQMRNDARPVDVETAVQRALDRFGATVENTLGLDAEGLARHGLYDPNKPLTDVQQDRLKDAFSDLFREMPVGALSPRLTEALKGAMQAKGLDTTNLESRQLKELGSVGRDLVRSMVEELRQDKPALFYGAAASLAAVAGYVTYAQGTDALGLAPQFSTRFFNDSFRAKLKVEWEEKLSNPTVTGRLEHFGTASVGGTNFNTQLGVGVVAQGASFSKLELTGLELSGSFAGTLNNGGAIGVSGNAIVGTDGKLSHVTLSGAYVNEPWTASVGATYFAQDERTVGQLSVGYRPSKNVDWALVGTTDSKGERYVGVGLRVRW